MWEPQGYRLPRAPWNQFSLDRVLLEFDGPRLILRRSEAGQLYLAWWSDTQDSIERWIYLPVSSSRLHTILSGGMPTLEALNRPEDGYILLVEENTATDGVLNIYMTDAESIPLEVLPLPNSRLNLDIPDDINSVPMQDRAHLIDIALESSPVQAGRVGARVLGQLIGNIQRLVDALGQAAAGNPTSRGSIPAEILQQTQLDVVSSYAGSFGVRLETHSQDDVLGESLGRIAIGSLFELLEAGSDLDKLTVQLQRLRGRVARSYEDFLGTMETSLPSTTIRWVQRWQPRYRRVSLTSQLARDIRIQVQDVHTSIEETFTLYGRLMMGNLLTGHFELVGGEPEDRISGIVSEDAEVQIQAVTLGSSCKAVLSPQIEISTTTGEQHTTYTLMEIEPLRA